ncbi:MAG: chitobiase/beta-hexosaminidase C-terminal domain-containing protein [Candidatus Merdisoma sp.]|jgi:tetratricopeptide (TPR) repeat protein
MKCPSCGRELKTGQLYCEHCGQEIQIVPDYDPLDELLIGREEPAEKAPDKPGKAEKAAESRGKPPKAPHRQETGKKQGGAFRKKWLLLLGSLAACFVIFVCAYRLTTRENSFSYQLRHGRALMEDEDYEAAIPYLERANELQADMEGADVEPLVYLAQAYAHTGADELAASCMEDAIAVEESVWGDENQLLELYLEYMEILNLTGQTSEIETVIEECPYSDICAQLLPYRVEKPSCDVPEGTYGYYLRMELSAEYGTIYYTLDGTMPTEESTRYERPIELREEGETLLTAVAVNQKGMVSEPLVLVYKLDFQDDAQ